MSSVRLSFEKRFGVKEAQAVFRAASEHSNGINDANLGSDPFKWALLMCIGYQCCEIDSYREHHGIKAPWDELKTWMIEEGELASHDGDSDYLALFAGAYNEFVGMEA